MRTSKKLDNLEFQGQQCDEWCWAAVAAMISSFYDGAAALTQCTIASITLNEPKCCTDCMVCNIEFDLDPALSNVNRFKPPVNGVLSKTDLMDKTDSEKPVCARIQFALKKGHFVAVKGYDNRMAGKLFLLISDPEKGELITLFEEFRDRYRGKGCWKKSYFTG
jgi:Papain-like cysteine protease AvrRpt2